MAPWMSEVGTPSLGYYVVSYVGTMGYIRPKAAKRSSAYEIEIEFKR